MNQPLDSAWAHFFTALNTSYKRAHLGDQHLPGFVLGVGGEKTDHLFLTCPVEMLDDQMIHRAGLVAVVTGQPVLVAAGAPRQRARSGSSPHDVLSTIWRTSGAISIRHLSTKTGTSSAA